LSNDNPLTKEDKQENFKAGYVAILGYPNAGKSTLLNQFLNYKLSIVSRKPQTTRKKVLGILTLKEVQIVFIDTPGLLNPKYNLQQIMSNYITNAIEDADVLLYLVDASRVKKTPPKTIQFFSKVDKPVVLAINKIDLVEKEKLLPLISHLDKEIKFSAVVPISALKDDGLDCLCDEIIGLLPYCAPYFPVDYLTDQQERFFVSEIIREKIFELYSEEIPYSTHVQIEGFKERSGRKDFIVANIYIEKNSQKGIIIGKEGRALKKIGQLARAEIEKFLDRPVYLELFVKVLTDWRHKDSKLKELGY
jgi:GTP-binding protein Era